MDERRIDPRTDPSFSLRNLLRTRAARERYSVAVVGTADGELMAGSQEDRPAWRVVAHAATALFREGSPGDRFERAARTRSARLTGVRFEARGRPPCLAVVEDPQHASGGGALEPALADMVRRVQAILSGD